MGPDLTITMEKALFKVLVSPWRPGVIINCSHFWSKIDRRYRRSMYQIPFFYRIAHFWNISVFPINSYKGNNTNINSMSNFLSDTNDLDDENTYHPLQTNVQWHQYPARYQHNLENWLFEILPFIRVYWKKRDFPKLGNAIKNTICDIDFRYLPSILLQKWLQQFNHFPTLRQKPVPQIAFFSIVKVRSGPMWRHQGPNKSKYLENGWSNSLTFFAKIPNFIAAFNQNNKIDILLEREVPLIVKVVILRLSDLHATCVTTALQDMAAGKHEECKLLVSYFASNDTN